MTAAALDASVSCLRCLPDEGTEPMADEQPSDDAPKEPPQYDWSIETYATEGLTQEQLSHALTLTNEEFVELCYTAEAATLAYQKGDGSQMAEVVLPGEAEHLCVRVYNAGNAQQIVVERDDALLTPERSQDALGHGHGSNQG